MDMRYVAYCYADRQFYDLPQNAATQSSGGRMFQVPTLDWSDWEIHVAEGWTYVSPNGLVIPDQGWKIHVSASFENAQELLNIVGEYCHAHRLSFKHLPAGGDLLRANTKYADRGGSGKFITLYPLDVDHCEQVLKDLDALVGGQDGPYILSDVRYNDGPLYVRYGGFRPMYMRGEADSLVAAIHGPDGELEPDVRAPIFSPPSWVQLPAFVVEQVVKLGGKERPESFRYDVKSSLHFSNGGGIYKAESLDRPGETVVLKEGRPFAGVTPDGKSALLRLRREAEFLRELSDIPGVVKYIDYFEQDGHEFLVQELVEGTTLNSHMVLRNPLTVPNVTDQEKAEYRDWALDILRQTEEAVREFHERGIIFGDLHPNNVMLNEDNQVRFIDFEMAYRIGETDIAPAGAPGFMPEDGRMGVSADLYSLGCMKLAFFIPLTVLLPVDPLKLDDLIARAKAYFDLTDEFCDSIRADLGMTVRRELSPLAGRTRDRARAWRIDDADATAALIDDIEVGIWNHADLSRVDRVFPGDIAQFSDGGYGIAHGASGVLLALTQDHPRRERVLDWIVDATRTPSQPAFGFFNGVAGAAHALRRFGRDEAAASIETNLQTMPLERLTSDYFSGLAGIGIHFMDEASRGVDNLNEGIERIRAILADRVDEDHSSIIEMIDGFPVARTDKGGLMRGLSGQALYWIRSFEHTGDVQDLDRGERLLREDCAVLVDCPDGSVQLNEGWRVMPYLASGAVGVGLVIGRLLQYRDLPDLREYLPKIALNLRSEFVMEPNLLNGRCGLMLYADQALEADLGIESPGDELIRQAHTLGLHALVHRDGLHFPGEQLMRLSCDWATGSAGVLSLLRTFAHRVHGLGQADYRLPLPGLDLRSKAREGSPAPVAPKGQGAIRIHEKGGESNVVLA